MRQAQDKFTTFVRFFPQTYSLEQQEHKWKKQLAIAQRLVRDYVPLVRAAVADVTDVYIPGGNRELLEAAAVFYGVANCCRLELKRDLSPYVIKTTDGGSYIALVEPECTRSDPEYSPTLHLPSLVACGNMTRSSEKYPVFSWSIDSRLSSREGYWQNNWTCDYEYLYEFMTGAITDCPASAEKFGRLRSRRFLSEDGQVNVMVVRGPSEAFFERIPKLSETILRAFADDALECAKLEARDYPSQLQDLVISWSAGEFVGNTVALMVMDILYGNGTFRPLNDREKITSNLLVFSDVLPA